MSHVVDVGYWVTRGHDEGDLAGALRLLSPEERMRHAALAPATARRDFAAAHALLRRALSMRLPMRERDWTFVPGRNGKPMLAPGLRERTGLSFNVAHAAGMVACAVARDVDVGVDVERIDEGADDLEVARHHFARAEVAALERRRGAERQARFIELWTLKEAHLKATGSGIATGLDALAFDLEEQGTIRFTPADRAHAAAWSFALFAIGEYRLAVAVRASGAAVALRLRDHGAPGGSPARGAAALLRASPGAWRAVVSSGEGPGATP